MTSPPQPATTQAPPPPDYAADTAAASELLIGIASILVSGGAIAGGVAAELDSLGPQLRMHALPRQAMLAALNVVISFPADQYGVAGPASMQISRMNLLRRAQFALAAARRISGDLEHGRAIGQPVGVILQQSTNRERRYFGQHLQALWNRAKAAAAVDSAAASYGLLLGWNTMLDAHTSAECRAASGKNFRADAMPLIGFPGAVHPHCRCYAGPAHPGARMLPGVRMPVRMVSAA